MTAAPPYDWIDPYMQRAADFLGLGDWAIRLEHQTGLSAQRGAINEVVQATCAASWPYLDAQITFDSQTWVDVMCEPSEPAKTIIVHELCHILLAGLSLAMEEIINVYFPSMDVEENVVETRKSVAFTLYRNHEEHTIVRLSRQIYAALERESQSAEPTPTQV